MTGNNPWPNVLADFKAKRQALDGIIASIETHFFNGAQPDEMPESPAEFRFTGKARRNGKRAVKASGRKKRIEKRQTDRQTEQAAVRRAARSLPDGADDILAALTINGGPMRPSELAERLRIARPLLTKQIKPLIKSKAVIATGTTMSRRFSLPGRGPKEAP